MCAEHIALSVFRLRAEMFCCSTSQFESFGVFEVRLSHTCPCAVFLCASENSPPLAVGCDRCRARKTFAEYDDVCSVKNTKIIHKRIARACVESMLKNGDMNTGEKKSHNFSVRSIKRKRVFFGFSLMCIVMKA